MDKDSPYYADLILYNGNILTMDPLHKKASFVAIKDNRIIAINNGNYHNFINDHTELIDCKGRTIIPGFIDPHFHLRSSAERYIVLNLEPSFGIRSIKDILWKVKNQTKNLPKGEWIIGKGYNEFYLDEKRHPNRWDLDQVSLEHPVKLTHRSGNAHVLNSFALKIVGISKDTPDPQDGLIERDLVTGEPTGVLYHMGKLLSEKITAFEDEKIEPGILALNKELLSYGITSIQDVSFNNNLKQWQIFKKWKTKNLLIPRISMLFGLDALKELDDANVKEDLQIKVRGIKIILDKTTGKILPEQKELCEVVLEIHRRGYQVAIHAIEEEEIEIACSAIEFALKRFPNNSHRHRIEHSSICPPMLAKRIASLGITIVSNPSFIYYHGERYLKTVPFNQIKHLYPFSSLKKCGIRLVGSSDSPLAPFNPLIGIYGAISRKTSKGDSLLPDENITPSEALEMYTQSASWICFEEDRIGSIAPGKLADIVLLSDDPTKTVPEKIKDIKVEMTIIDGKIVWRSDREL